MFYWSHFVQHFADNQRKMPRREAEAVRAAALARLAERQAAGRADGPLLFDDLIERIERAVQPSTNH